MWKERDAERQSHKDTRRQRERDQRDRKTRDTGRLMGEKIEKCGSKDSRTQSYRERNVAEQRQQEIGGRKRYQESET